MLPIAIPYIQDIAGDKFPVAPFAKSSPKDRYAILYYDLALDRKETLMWHDDCEDEYAGTYAHDVAGFTDEEIDTIFDGEPETYWNID